MDIWGLCGGTRVWKVDGKLHRLDGPAIEWFNGDTEWWAKGIRHRLDGPAIEYADGGKQWWVDGKLHRVNGPAVESSGAEEWWVDGKLHRLDGPAVECINGRQQWLVNDCRISQKEFSFYVFIHSRLQKILPVCRALKMSPGKFQRLLRLSRSPAVVEWFYDPNNTGGKIIKQRGMRSIQKLLH